MTDNIIIEGRVMYPDVITPSRFKDQRTNSDQWLIRVMIPKDDREQMTAIVNAIQSNDRAIAQYGDSLIFDPGAQVIGIIAEDGTWRNQPIRDGNSARYPEEANDHWIIHAKALAPNRPGVLDGNMQQITDASVIYSGCVCNVAIGVKCYNAQGNRGIAWFLNGVQYVRGGPVIKLGGAPSADTIFGKIKDAEPVSGPAGDAPSPYAGSREIPETSGSFLD